MCSSLPLYPITKLTPRWFAGEPRKKYTRIMYPMCVTSIAQNCIYRVLPRNIDYYYYHHRSITKPASCTIINSKVQTSPTLGRTRRFLLTKTTNLARPARNADPFLGYRPFARGNRETKKKTGRALRASPGRCEERARTHTHACTHVTAAEKSSGGGFSTAEEVDTVCHAAR